MKIDMKHITMIVFNTHTIVFCEVHCLVMKITFVLLDSAFFFCSLFRSNELAEAEVRFIQLKDTIPLLVGISREVGIISHQYILQDGRVSDRNFSDCNIFTSGTV
jgi:hypothetical protein